MVAGPAARPPWSAPGCQSEPESNRSPLGVSVPASFMGLGERRRGRKWRQPRLYRTLVRESRGQFLPLLICLPRYVYPALLWRPGLSRPRLCLSVTQRCLEWLSKNPNRIPEGEQARSRSDPADERKPFGFPLISHLGFLSYQRKGRSYTEPRRVTDLRND